jgi:hypothetical protein
VQDDIVVAGEPLFQLALVSLAGEVELVEIGRDRNDWLTGETGRDRNRFQIIGVPLSKRAHCT